MLLRWRLTLVAVGFLGVGCVAVSCFFNSEGFAAKRAVAQLNEGDWAGMFESAIADEPSMLQCNKASFIALMKDVVAEKPLTYSLRGKRQSAGSRPAAVYIVEVRRTDGTILENTVTLYLAKQDGDYRVSIGDLPFQIALLDSQSLSASLSDLANAMRAASVSRLVNPQDMISTTPDRIDRLISSEGENLNPAHAWTRLSGF